MTSRLRPNRHNHHQTHQCNCSQVHPSAEWAAGCGMVDSSSRIFCHGVHRQRRRRRSVEDWYGGCRSGLKELLLFFQMKYSVNITSNVELLETWERTTTLLMWPWPVGMTIGWRLTGWSWLSRYSLIDYCTVGITSTSTTSTSLLNSRLKAAAGHWWSRQPDQIFFLSGCWAAGIELSSIFLFR